MHGTECQHEAGPYVRTLLWYIQGLHNNPIQEASSHMKHNIACNKIRWFTYSEFNKVKDQIYRCYHI